MITKKATSEKVDKGIKTCLVCSSELKDAEFYKSRNKLIDERFSICKNCAIREGNDSIHGFHKILMLLDIPFLPELYKDCEGSDNVFSAYMLRINNPRKKNGDGKKISDLTYDDSPTLQQVTDVDTYIYASDDMLYEFKMLFGDNWTRDELIMMNKELDEMIVQYGGKREDMATMDLYCELIRLKWLARKQMDKGEIKTGKELIAERNKMLKENGMTVQAMREKNSNESFGVEIDYAEEEPIIPDKKYFDIDGIWFMFQKLIKHMERFRGLNKSDVDDDYKDMEKHLGENVNYREEME